MDFKLLAEKKNNAEEKLTNLEKKIYALERSYLQDTTTIGNIVAGWDKGRLKKTAKPKPFKESDRLFSLSSVTTIKRKVWSTSSNANESQEDHPELKEHHKPPKLQKNREKGSRKAS